MKNKSKNWLKKNWIPTIIVIVMMSVMFLSSVSSESHFKVYKGIEMEVGEGEFIKDIEIEEVDSQELTKDLSIEWLNENCKCLTRGDRIMDKSCVKGQTINQDCFECEKYSCGEYLVEVWY